MMKPTDAKQPTQKTYTHEQWEDLHERMDRGDVQAWAEWDAVLDAHESERHEKAVRR